MELNRAYIFSATGLLDEATRVLAAIDEAKLTEPQLWKYADRMLFVSSHRDQYVGDHGRNTAYPDEIDSLLQRVLPRISSSDRYYSWFTGWGHFKNKEEASGAIKDIKPIVDNSKFTTRDDALNAWTLSKLYEYAGDLNLKLKYLILSAMADIRASNKEIASLQEVSAILYDLGELERSNIYINYCIRCANEYKSRVRLAQLGALQDKTMSDIFRHSQSQTLQNKRMLGFLIVALAVLMVALIFIIRQMRQLTSSRQQLHRTNVELRERVEELQQTREELAATITVLSGTARASVSITQEAKAPEPVDPTIEVPEGYEMVWNDEFDGTALNASDWRHEVQGPGWVNNELQNYVNGSYDGIPVTQVDNGILSITCFKSGSRINSGRIYAKVNEGWKYGIFEARIKLPKGKGTWPAFWMMPVNNDFSTNPWPRCGEIDIMEEVGYNPNYTSSSIHCDSYNHVKGTQKTAERYTTGAQDDFHVYRLEWTENYIRTYVDGNLLLNFPNDGAGNVATWPFNKPFYLILNLAWGGDWGGAMGIDESALPATMQVDYVRVFQKI